MPATPIELYVSCAAAKPESKLSASSGPLPRGPSGGPPTARGADYWFEVKMISDRPLRHEEQDQVMLSMLRRFLTQLTREKAEQLLARHSRSF